MAVEKNFDFLKRHWTLHRPGRRDAERTPRDGEIMLDESWSLGTAPDAPETLIAAVRDFQDYLAVSFGLPLPLVWKPGKRTVWFAPKPDAPKRGFSIDASPEKVTLEIAPWSSFMAVVHLEDCMNLEGAPVFAPGHIERHPLYKYRMVHSGCGHDKFPDEELAAIVHAGYDSIIIFVKGPDLTAGGPCDIADLMKRAKKFELKFFIYNYIQTFIHPDEPGAQEKFDAAYGELFKRYPGISGIMMCGESLEFPSHDQATTGKRRLESFTDGIPDVKPSPGWYPCFDYPDYLHCIERAVHKYEPAAEVIFSTYNWGYAPAEQREKFLQAMPGGITLTVTYEIFSQKMLEGLHTPVMDYTISTDEPGYYFKTECAAAHRCGIPIQGNVNTAGIGWDLGCINWVPTPWRWLKRDLDLRKACREWGVDRHYATHHYGWWNSVAADLGKWTQWEDFEPDYEELLRKLAIRDYGHKAAPAVLETWRIWGEAMHHYVGSNEDQYGPWRVGPAFPFIFHPNITRTMGSKVIKFPCKRSGIIETFYQPFENIEQSPGFLRYPVELRSLEKMLALWEQGLTKVQGASDTDNGRRLIALGHFIRNTIRTTMNIKRWWQLNMELQTCENAENALKVLDELEALAAREIANTEDTIPSVESDSRLGWEATMDYVCDRWHLEWKIRQVKSALLEIADYRRIVEL